MVPGVFWKLVGGVGLSVAGTGVDDVVPNNVPVLSGLGPGLEVSCFGTAGEKIPVGRPVVVGVVGVEDGKATFASIPPAGLFAPGLNMD